MPLNKELQEEAKRAGGTGCVVKAHFHSGGLLENSSEQDRQPLLITHEQQPLQMRQELG